MDYDTAAAKSAILGSLGSGSMRYGPGNDRLTGPLYSPDANKQSSPFDVLGSAQMAVVEAHARVMALATRLCGPQPGHIGGTEARPTQNGLFDLTAETGAIIRNLAEEISATVDRIQSRLP